MIEVALEEAGAPSAPAEELVKLAQGPQSILDAVRGKVADRTRKATKVLPVGVIDGLTCRYRALDDDRRNKIGEQAVEGAGDDLDRAGRDAASAILAAAAVTLLWHGEPLHELLEIDGPIGYTREAADLLGLEFDEKPSTIDIVVALHTLGESTAPLETAGTAYLNWLTGKRVSAVEWALTNS